MIKKIIVLATLVTSLNAFAHGEDKYGPNKGYIRMPGTFHVELVPQGDKAYSVYLLTLQNQEPLTKNSSVELKVKTSNQTIPLKCEVEADHFICKSNNVLPKQGQVLVKTTRDGKKASEAKYDLPLTLKEEANKPVDHSMHKM